MIQLWFVLVLCRLKQYILFDVLKVWCSQCTRFNALYWTLFLETSAPRMWPYLTTLFCNLTVARKGISSQLPRCFCFAGASVARCPYVTISSHHAIGIRGALTTKKKKQEKKESSIWEEFCIDARPHPHFSLNELRAVTLFCEVWRNFPVVLKHLCL